jgi:hypothetical protein
MNAALSARHEGFVKPPKRILVAENLPASANWREAAQVPVRPSAQP